MATIGSYTLIKNESRWIRAHLLSWLPWLDQAVFFDGNSTDGTLDIIRDIAANHPFGHRIKLVENKDPKDLDKDYQRIFNECLRSLSTDYAAFIHPDMILDEPGNIGFLGDAVAYTVNVRSFAGEPDGQMYEIKTGRTDRWKNIMRLKNPDLGLHYWGAYGQDQEDCYFSKITGSKHELHLKPRVPGELVRGIDFAAYPYEIKDSGIKISHFSDVRPYERRKSRMIKCLINQGIPENLIETIAETHPRVTFENAKGFTFEPVETPSYLLLEGATA